MKAMPFLVAEGDSVHFSEHVLRFSDHTFTAADEIVGWDYLTRCEVVCDVEINWEDFLSATMLPSAEFMGVYLQVDCPATRFRQVESVTCETNLREYVLQMEIEPGEIAQELEVRSGVYLAKTPPDDAAGTAATRIGSKLAESGKASRFSLEGQGSAFPIEVFDFSATDFPVGSPWHLHVSTSDLDEPFKRAVRLYVNQGHANYAELSRGDASPESSVLRHDLVLELLLTASQMLSDRDSSRDYAEGSLGEVAETLSTRYLRKSLVAFKKELASDPNQLLTELRHSTRLLEATK